MKVSKLAAAIETQLQLPDARLPRYRIQEVIDRHINRAGYFLELYTGALGSARWRLMHRNGQVLPHAYNTKSSRDEVARRFAEACNLPIREKGPAKRPRKQPKRRRR